MAPAPQSVMHNIFTHAYTEYVYMLTKPAWTESPIPAKSKNAAACNGIFIFLIFFLKKKSYQRNWHFRAETKKMVVPTHVPDKYQHTIYAFHYTAQLFRQFSSQPKSLCTQDIFAKEGLLISSETTQKLRIGPLQQPLS